MKKGQAYLCQSCGVRFSRWQGSCHSCGAWDSLVHSPPESPSVRDRSFGSRKERGFSSSSPSVASTPFRPLGDEDGTLERVATGLTEVDRALGGGLVPGSVLLLGGDPGVGKSTLALQIAEALLARFNKGAGGEENSAAVYVSGEEDRAQLALRAKRLQREGGGVLFSMRCYARRAQTSIPCWSGCASERAENVSSSSIRFRRCVAQARKTTQQAR